MTGVAAANPKQQFFDSAGNPLVGGFVDVYLAGTTTRTDTWRERTLIEGNKNTNPIELDARGECALWLDEDVTYKLVLKNAAGVVQYTADNVVGAAGVHILADVTAAKDAALVAIGAAEDASVAAVGAAEDVSVAAVQAAQATAEAAVDALVTQAETAQTAAGVSATAAALSAAAAQAADGSFADQAGGRAATVDGQSFLVRTADPQVYDVYRRDSAGASTLLGTISFAPVTGAQTALDASLLDARELFDRNKLTADFSVLSVDGTLAAAAGISTTAKIPVTPGSQFVVSTNMTSTGGAGIAYYGPSGTFVSGAVGVTSGTAVTVPANAYFVRFSVSTTNVSKAHMYKAAALPAIYKDFAYQDRLTAHSKMVEWLGELMAPINLFDSTRATDSFIIDSTDGSVDAQANWYCSDYMPVQAGGSIYVTPGNAASSSYGISWYDVDRNWISGTAGPTTAGAYSVPAGATYARINNSSGFKSRQMVVPGSSAPASYRSFPTGDLNTIALQDHTLIEAFNGPQNLYDNTNVTAGALRVVGTLDTGLTGWVTSHFIPVTPGGSITNNYSLSGTSTYGFVYYGLDKTTIIGTLPLPLTAGTFAVPTGAYYVRITMSSGFRDYAMLYRGTTVPTVFVPNPNSDWGYRAKRWLGADFGIIGDSITASDFWQADVCKYLGATLALNDGVNGRQMAGAFSDAVETNSTTVAALDVLGVFLGTNDFGNSRPLGSLSDAAGAATFVGDTRTVIETILGWHPTIRLFFMTPLHRLTANTPNAQGLKLVDYADMLLDVCGDYGVPVLDLYRTSGMNAVNATANTVSNDGLHPTSTMAPVWIGKPLRSWLDGI
jgi:lysophospholipase L1-like esterase